MIYVAGTMNLDPAVIGNFQRDVAAMLDKVRAEKGCRHYALRVEDAKAGLVNVLEQWDDDAALIVHLKQPWITETTIATEIT
jgi:quinol monooxygenase YgiN